jgi:hypothetical protein
MSSASVGDGGANHGHGQNQPRSYQDSASAIWRCECIASSAASGALMRIAEIKPQRPLTPDQQRIKSMQARVKQAQQAVKAERARQKIQAGQKELAHVTSYR